MKRITRPPTLSLCSFLLAAGILAAQVALGADITMSAGDASGTSSFNTGLNWPGGLAPSSGNNYFVPPFASNNQLRSPGDSTAYTFGGDSLTILSGAVFMNKASGSRTLTANWVLDGGLFRSGAGSTQIETYAGTLAVTSNGGEIRGDQSPYIVSASTTLNGGLNLNASTYAITYNGGISGSGSIVKNGGQTLTLNGANTMSSSGSITANSGTVQVYGDYSGFQGTYTHNTSSASSVFYGTQTTSANGKYVVSAQQGAAQGILLNNTGAATYQLGSLAGISNSLVRNTGGSSGQTTVQIGNLGTDTEFAGIIGGGGGTMALTKVGSGKLTLSGASTFSGATTISAGTLVLSGSGSINNSSSITVASGATFDVSGVTYTLPSGKTLQGAGSIVGSATISGSLIPGNAGAGTLACGANLTFSSGSSTFELSTSASSGNDLVTVAGDLSLSSADTIHISALSGAANLEEADYTLFQVTGTTTMSTTPNLVWDGTPPANFSSYAIALAGNGKDVVLKFAVLPLSVGDSTFAPASPAIAGDVVEASATVSSGTAPYSYQWQTDTGSGYGDISGANSSTYNIDTTGQENTMYGYRLIVTDSSTPTAAIVTNTPATLTVNPLVATLHFTFEDSGVTTVDNQNGVTLNLTNAAGASADMHGAEGTGVAGLGKALDFTSAPGGFASAGPQAITRNDSTVNFGALSQWTVSMWVKLDTNNVDVPSYERFFILGDTATADSGAANSLAFLGNANLTSLQVNYNSAQDIPSGITIQPPGTWTYIAWTYDGANGRFYTASESSAVGSPVTVARSATVNIGSAFNLSVGNRMSNNQRGLDAYIDDVRFYPRALSANQLEDVRKEAALLNVLATTFTPASPVNAGTAVTASAVVAGGTAPYAYQWQIDTGSGFGDISGATSSTYDIDTTGQNGTDYAYRLIVTDNDSIAFTNTAAALTVNATTAPVIGDTTFTPASPYWGESVTGSATFDDGGSAITSYQWQSSPDGSSWSDISGATSDSYLISDDVQPADAGIQYRVIAVNVIGATTNNPSTLPVADGVSYVNTGATAPTPGTYDLSQLDNTGSTGSPGGLNYFVDNATPPGQTFTTGSKPAGYILNEVYVKTGSYSTSPSSYTLRLYSVSGTTATLLGEYQNDNTLPTVTAGEWVRFGGDITNHLNPDTTYAYTIARNGSGWWRPDNASGNPYAGGQVCLIPTAGGTIDTGSSSDYDATFLIKLTGLNSAPQAQDITVGMAELDTVTLTIIGSKFNPIDADGDAVEVVNVTQGASGTVTFDGTSVTYENTSIVENDTFTYTVRDLLGDTSVGTVNVTFRPNNSGPPLTGVDNGSGQFKITTSGIPGMTYDVEARTMDSDVWSAWGTISTATAAGNGVVIWEDSELITAHQGKQYRLKQQ